MEHSELELAIMRWLAGWTGHFGDPLAGPVFGNVTSAETGMTAWSAGGRNRLATSARDGIIQVWDVETRTKRATLEGHLQQVASLAFHPFGQDNASTIILSANNIFDTVARRHASFLKDYAPLAGRDLRISARFTF